jgi:hypothetical protein
MNLKLKRTNLVQEQITDQVQEDSRMLYSSIKVPVCYTAHQANAKGHINFFRQRYGQISSRIITVSPTSMVIYQVIESFYQTLK